MKRFLRNNDTLGSTPMMTYKSNTVFGTSLGGCCSMLVSISMGLYVCIILIGFFASPDYSLQTQELYQPLVDPETYSISATEIIPAVSVLTNF